jgi:hypothetical protein
MKKITIYEYIANNVPSDAHFVINKYGGNYTRARNVKELEAQLKDFVKKNGKQGLLALAEIHPDKELVSLVDKDSQKSNFNDSDQLPQFANATGTSVITKTDKEELTYSKILILGGFLLLGIAIITKK